MLKLVILLTVVVSTSRCQEETNALLKLKYGIELAAKLFGVGGSEGLASTFTSSLLKFVGNTQRGAKGDDAGSKRKEENFMKNGFLAAVVRSLGLNSGQMGAVAVNVIISIAKMISDAYAKSGFSLRRQRNSGQFSPFQLIMGQSQVTRLMLYMQDPDLVDRILAEMNTRLEGYSAKDVECIKLLVCKTSPFVWGMQRSFKFFSKQGNKIIETTLKGDGGTLGGVDHRREDRAREYAQDYSVSTTKLGLNVTGKISKETDVKGEVLPEEKLWEKSEPVERMYLFLPSLSEVVKYGDVCDERFPSCLY